MSTMATDPSLVPATQQLSKNPQLPQHPLGAYTDAQYEAQNAALRSNIAKQYADILQQLGYIDPNTGQFIQGSVETDAARQKGLLNRQMGLADEDVTNQHQQLGTLFSGLRGTDQARAEFPMTDALGQLATQTPLTLSKLYEQGAGLTSDYTIQDNQLLADAAQRQAAAMQQPGLGGATAGDTTPDPNAPNTSAPVQPTPGSTYTGGDVAPMVDWGAAAAAPAPSTSTPQAAPPMAINPGTPDFGTGRNDNPPPPVPGTSTAPGISIAAQKKLADMGSNTHYAGAQM